MRRSELFAERQWSEFRLESSADVDIVNKEQALALQQRQVVDSPNMGGIALSRFALSETDDVIAPVAASLIIGTSAKF